jgi:hypothetical protein
VGRLVLMWSTGDGDEDTGRDDIGNGDVGIDDIGIGDFGNGDGVSEGVQSIRST